MTTHASLPSSQEECCPEDLQRLMEKLAIWHSRKLVFRLGLAKHEAEDIQQEIHLALWLACDRFDTTRSALGTFLRRVAENEVKTLIAHRRAARRGHGRCTGLDEETFQRVNGSSKNPFRTEKRILMRLDVRLKVNSLPSKLRRTAIALEQDSPTEAARRLNICRDTVYRRVTELRGRFASLGFDAYLD